MTTDRRPVAIKTRYLVDEQKVFKVDSNRVLPLSTQATADLIAALEERLPGYDALIVTDFGYGLFNQAIIDAVARVCGAQGKPYYLDVSHTRRASILRFRGARLATPTEQELRFAFADNEAGLSHLAALFFDQTQTERLMLTMGKRGVLLFARPSRPRQRLKTDFLPALDSAAVDAIGAGDVFLAAATLSDLAGASPQVGAYFGAALAAVHVSRLGNHPVELSTLHGYLAQCRELTP
jgi:D-beta-D-heptose 7-phosphate kinase/D-beta-D-heptose 1-phosphate adenosyltransferase